MTEECDADLIQAARQGNSGALEALIRIHYPRVVSLASRFLGNARDAEDAAQEAVFKASRYLSSYDGRSSFATWLHAITRNVVTDHARRRSKIAPASVLHEDPALEEPADERDVLSGRSRIEQMVSRLPEDLRWVVLYVYQEGLSPREVAEILDISVNAVRIRLFKGLRHLRSALERGSHE